MNLNNYRIAELNINSALQFDYLGSINKQDAKRTKVLADMIVKLDSGRFAYNITLTDIDGLKQSAGIFLSELERDCPEYFV